MGERRPARTLYRHQRPPPSPHPATHALPGPVRGVTASNTATQVGDQSPVLKTWLWAPPTLPSRASQGRGEVAGCAIRFVPVLRRYISPRPAAVSALGLAAEGRLRVDEITGALLSPIRWVSRVNRASLIRPRLRRIKCIRSTDGHRRRRKARPARPRAAAGGPRPKYAPSSAGGGHRRYEKV
jgi:hypothetical protein